MCVRAASVWCVCACVYACLFVGVCGCPSYNLLVRVLLVVCVCGVIRRVWLCVCIPCSHACVWFVACTFDGVRERVRV